jgi:hypothetical protein
VLHHRLDQFRGGPGPVPGRPLPWLPSPIGIADPAWRAHVEQRAALIAGRVDDLASEVVTDRPPWGASLGPIPRDSAERVRWRRIAALAAAYREHYDVGVEAAPGLVGSEPRRDTRQHRAWTFVRDVAARGIEPVGTRPDLDSSLRRIASAKTNMRQARRSVLRPNDHLSRTDERGTPTLRR